MHMTEPLVNGDYGYRQASVPAAVPRKIGFLGEPYLAAASWCLAWYGIVRLWYGQLGPYVFAVSLAMHVRICPPMGQVPPIMDPMVIFIWPWCLGMCLLSCAIVGMGFIYGWEWWWWMGTAFACMLALMRRRDVETKVKDAFARLGRPRDLPGVVPRRPLLTTLHGYTYVCFREVCGGDAPVCIERFTPSGSAIHVDIWRKNGVAREKLPVFFFAHGGGWKGGGARMNPHCALMQILASRGWMVVSAEYRMRRWPQQLDDVVAALRWLQSDEAAEHGADRDRITVSGASAGGHIISLAMLKAHTEGIKISSMVLFYPALDPGDLSVSTARWPLSIPFLRAQRDQSMLHWFFELVVLGSDQTLWPSATVLTELHPDSPVAREWPPTLVIHGELDSVVPVEHSQNFLSMLAAAQRQADSQLVRACDGLVLVPGARHTFDIVSCKEAAATFEGAAAWLQMTV